jgi:class 3 adenylate cyclase
MPVRSHQLGRSRDRSYGSTRICNKAATPLDPERVLATVLFTDIVGSTDRAAELGDGTV